MSADEPTVLLIRQFATETTPIVIEFSRDVTGVPFSLEHGAWATSTVIGDGTRVSIPITEARAAVTPSTYNYKLIKHAGVEGHEEIACMGPWRVVAT